MSAICGSTIKICRTRVTRLDSVGNPEAGPNNVYVTDKQLMLTATPQIEAGVERTLVGGCDCIVAHYHGYDKLKFFTLELDMGTIEPALIEMLIGADAITEGGSVAGDWWPSQLSCSDAAQPNVCFEAWTDRWQDDAPAASPVRYMHWIWPSSFWQIAPYTLQLDFLQPKFTAFTRANSNWGLGIYGDQPEAAGPLGGFFPTDTLPDALCDYQSEPLT